MFRIPSSILIALVLAACASTGAGETPIHGDWPVRAAIHREPGTLADPGPIDLTAGLQLATLIEIAADRNPKLAAARRRWQAGAERPAQAESLPDPLFGYTEFLDPIETRLGPMDRQVSLTQKIPFPGKLSAAGALAGEEARIAELGYHIAIRDTVADVKVVYAEYLYLRKALRIVKENQTLATHLAEKSAALYAQSEKGRKDTVSLFDSLKAQSQLAQLAYDEITVEELLQVESVNLNALLSRAPRAPLGEPHDLAFRPLDATLDDLLRLGLSRRQELEAALHRIAAAGEAERIADLAWVPDFSVGVTYTFIGGHGVDQADAGKDAVGLNFGLTLPLWVTKNRARVREAEYRRMAAESDRQATIDDLMSRITKVFFRLQNAERLVRLYQESLLPQAEEAMEIAEQWRDVGRDTIGRLLEARSVWLNFNLAYHRALADHEQMVARLEQLVGMSLGGYRKAKATDERE
jgi:outer membrane protein, heavy metal efflux system